MDAETLTHAVEPYRDGFPERADLPPGTVLAAGDATLAHAVLPPEIAARVAAGDVSLTVAPTQSYPLPPAYVAATVAGAPGVRLDEHGHLIGYEAGLPFPVIDPHDPDAGTKIAWNLRYRSLGGDTEAIRVRWTTLDGAVPEAIQDMLAWRLRLTRRCVLPPRDLSPNPLDLYEVLVSELLSPPELCGWLSTTYRYNDPGKSDDVWVYTPTRVTALKSDYRSEDGYGYNGTVHSQQWRYLGTRDVLCGVGIPSGVPAFGGRNGWYPDDPVQLRRCHVLEAVAKDPDHHYARRIFYIDAELWMPVYTLGYDKTGRCFKLIFHLFGDPAHNPWASPDHAGPINLGGCALDLARGHATLLPNTEQRFNTPVEDHPCIRAALAGKAPVDAGIAPREGFRWIAIGHTADVVEILPGRLYRSGLPSQQVLDDGGIDIVINLSGRNPTDLQRTAASGRVFVYWPIEDDELPDVAMLEHLARWVAGLLETTEKRILVHCVASVNRSNLVAGSILHRHLGLGGEALIRHLEARSDGYAILTNRAFRDYLRALPDTRASA